MHDCGGTCVGDDQCCPHTEKECPDGSCLSKNGGACCAGVEVACATAPGGCCNSFAGEECADDGCCNTFVGQAVCGGKCLDTDSDPNNCGGCGVKCARCQVCQNGTCRNPRTGTPDCEGCVNGEVRKGPVCGDRCCPPGSECCGGGCCAAGKCDSINGQTCCHKVIDNRPYCQVM